MIVVRFGDDLVATLHDYRWHGEDETWLTVLAVLTDAFVLSPFDDDPDRTLADYIVREMGGHIVEATRPAEADDRNTI